MSAKAVVVLAALARDEFERAWHGYEKPFDFLDPELAFDGSQPEPVDYLIAEIDGNLFRLPARDTADKLIRQLANFREEVEEDEQAAEEAAEERGEYRSSLYTLTDEDMDERAWERLERYWTDELEYASECLAVFDVKLRYVVEAWKEMVADFTMIGERMPELKPVLAEKLQEVYDQMMADLGSLSGGE